MIYIIIKQILKKKQINNIIYKISQTKITLQNKI